MLTEGLQYEYIGSKGEQLWYFCCQEEEVPLARLVRIKKEYYIFIVKGEAIYEKKERFREAKDIWPHVFIQLKVNPEWFIKEARSNHIHIVYGDYQRELYHFFVKK